MKKFKIYFDKDAENQWINRMAEQGYALTGFKTGMYTFEPCQPGEFIYLIDLIDQTKDSFEEYCADVEKTGAEMVCRWFRWVFWRMPASEGEFEVFADNEAKAAQYERVAKFCILFMFVEFLLGLMEMTAALATKNPAIGVMAAVLLALGVIFLVTIIRFGLKANRLRGIS